MARVPLISSVPPGNPGASGIVRGTATVDFDAVHPSIGASINAVREEVDDAFKDMETFYNREPDEIMRMASGHSARLSYIRVRVLRVEDYHREWKDVRLRDLEPCLEQLREQWSHGSRMHSSRELDWRMESGER